MGDGVQSAVTTPQRRFGGPPAVTRTDRGRILTFPCRIPTGSARPRREREDRARDERSRGPCDGADTTLDLDTTRLEDVHTLVGGDATRWAQFERDLLTHVHFVLRGRAGLIVRTVVGPRSPGVAPLTSLSDLSTYRLVMETGTWATLAQAVLATRSYEAGLDAGLLLLRVADLHREDLSHEEYAAHRKHVYWLILELLDRLDRWDAYLSLWAYLRVHTTYALTLQSAARDDARLAPFMLGEDAGGLQVHFLWLMQHRKAVIERKLQRQRRGTKLGRVWHANQAELSDAEIRERLQSVLQRMREVPQRW